MIFKGSYFNGLHYRAAIPAVISPVKYLSHSKLVIVQNEHILLWNYRH